MSGGGSRRSTYQWHELVPGPSVVGAAAVAGLVLFGLLMHPAPIHLEFAPGPPGSFLPAQAPANVPQQPSLGDGLRAHERSTSTLIGALTSPAATSAPPSGQEGPAASVVSTERRAPSVSSVVAAPAADAPLTPAPREASA